MRFLQHVKDIDPVCGVMLPIMSSLHKGRSDSVIIDRVPEMPIVVRQCVMTELVCSAAATGLHSQQLLCSWVLELECCWSTAAHVPSAGLVSDD
jgi:hypothetical protein